MRGYNGVMYFWESVFSGKKYLKNVDYYIFIYIMCYKYFIILILGYDVILVFFYF